MKKIFFAVVMVAVALSASAQPQEKADFKTGKNSVEIGFNPFNTDWENFRIDELKYRRFFGNHALRVGFGIEVTSNKDGDITTYDKDLDNGKVGSLEQYTRANRTELQIAAGYEYHFNVAPRVSLYAGGELGYIGSIGKSTEYKNEIYTRYNDENKILGTYDYLEDITNKGESNSNAFFVNVLAGMDFHVYRGLYLGAEIKLGYKYQKFSDGFKDGSKIWHQYDDQGKLVGGEELTYSTDGARQTVTGYTIAPDGSKTKVDEVESDKENVSSYQAFKLRAEGAFRIGYRF